MAYQGSREINSAPGITLACITAEARELMDVILDQCPDEIREDATTDRFLAWLFDSGLATFNCTLEQVKALDAEWVNRMAASGNQRHDPVYGCTYWLCRYSELIVPRM